MAEPVRAPLTGEIATVIDGIPDRLHLNPWRDSSSTFVMRPFAYRNNLARMVGNHIIIDGGTACALLAHVRCGSIVVAAGDCVAAGQTLAELGNSGNIVGPHLHFQVMDRPDVRVARAIPFRIRRYQFWAQGVWQTRENTPLPAKRAQIRVT